MAARAKKKVAPAQSDGDILADIAERASEAIQGSRGTVVVTVKRMDGGIGIGLAVGTDLCDLEEVRSLLELALRKI